MVFQLVEQYVPFISLVLLHKNLLKVQTQAEAHIRDKERQLWIGLVFNTSSRHLHHSVIRSHSVIFIRLFSKYRQSINSLDMWSYSLNFVIGNCLLLRHLQNEERQHTTPELLQRTDMTDPAYIGSISFISARKSISENFISIHGHIISAFVIKMLAPSNMILAIVIKLCTYFT